MLLKEKWRGKEYLPSLHFVIGQIARSRRSLSTSYPWDIPCVGHHARRNSRLIQDHMWRIVFNCGCQNTHGAWRAPTPKSLTPTANIRHQRPCSECSKELKSIFGQKCQEVSKKKIVKKKRHSMIKVKQSVGQ